MMNNYFKVFLMACFVFVAGYSHGQIRLGDKPEVGQTYVQDAETQQSILSINFNTNRDNSTWVQVDDTTTTINWSKCQNNRGFAAAVYVSDEEGAATVINDDLRVRSGRWRSNENPVRVASIDSLQAMLLKWQEVNEGDANSIDKPSACLFDIDESNQAYGIHPGIYKKLEHEIVFRFADQYLTSDVSFTIDTYDEGNTGQTATYELELDFGSTNVVISDFYTTGSGPMAVNLAEATGLQVSDLSGVSEVHLYLRTNGTGTEIAQGVYDPTVVIDDILVSFAYPVWAVPSANSNDIVDNESSPLEGELNVTQTFGINLQTKSRRTALSIEDNLYINGMGDNSTKVFTFLDTLGVMANDGAGNYTVEVPYTLTPAVYDAATLSWSKQKIIIDAPDDVTDDDLMFFFEATPSVYPAQSARLELNNGTRFWYDIFIQATPISLDSLSVSEGELIPAFDSDVTEYQLTLPAGTKGVTFAASSGDTSAVITLPDASNLSDGGYYNVAVTSADATGATVKSYNVHIHVQSDNEVLFVSASNGVYETAQDYDKNVFDALKEAGYSVTFGKKGTIFEWSPEGINPFDYSPYSALVFSAIESSSNLIDYAKRGYPIPCVTLQPDGVKNDKWGWVNRKNTAFWQNIKDTPYSVDDVKLRIVNNNNYITSGYEVDDLVTWTNGTPATENWDEQELKIFNIQDSIPTAIPLGQYAAMGPDTMYSMYAVPAGTQVYSVNGEYDNYEHVTTGSNVVIMGLFHNGLNDASDAFDDLLIRSLEWAMNAHSDAALATLVPSEGELSPSFGSGTTEYQLNLPMGTSAVSFTATAIAPNATVIIPEELALSDGMTETATITVISADLSDTTDYNVMVHVQSDKEILYLSASNGAYGSARAFDTNVYDGLVEAGYSVTFAKKGSIFEWTPEAIVPFDYSPYIGMVIGGGESSSNVNDYAKRNYPIPVVSMQNDGPKSNKWGWVNDKNAEQFKVTKSYDATTAQMQVTNNEHYITQVYDVDEVITWTSGTADSEDFLGKEIKSYNLLDSVETAIPLITIPADGSLLTTMWAIPEGASVRSMNGDYETYERVTTSSNVVLMYLFNDGLLYATDEFDNLLVRSLEWAIGASSDASLATLVPSDGELTPSFDTEVTEYQLNLPKGSSAISFTATASSPNAIVELPDELSLSDGDTETATIMVISADLSDTTAYNVTVHVQSDNEILYLSASNGAYGSAKAFDTNVYDALVDAGYSVTFAKKGSIFEWTPDSIKPFDYSPYIGMVIGGGESSSNVNDYAKRNYPIPVVSMQNDGPKNNKWGWVNDKNAEQFKVTKSYDATTAQMKVTNNEHYITQNYNVDDIITWTSGTAESEDFLGKEIKSYNLTDSVETAIPLVTIPADGSLLTTMWAIPEGASVRSMNGDYDTYERVTTSSRVVLLYLFNDGLLYATDEFDNLLTRSLEWALGNETDATLASLEPSVGTLVQDFDPEKTEYQLNLPMGTTAVSFTATATSANATVEIPEELTLSDGMDQVVSVVVTSADGSTSTSYNVTVHVQSEVEILFVSNSDGVLGAADAGTVSTYDAIKEAGYSVTLAGKLAINTNEFDYSPYSGLVIGAGVGSSWVNGFAVQGYPIPAVTMQHDGPRNGKWGWLETDKDDNVSMNVAKTTAETTTESVKMQVLSNEHYITQGFQVGDLLEWQNGTFDDPENVGRELKSYDLSASIPTAIALGTIPIESDALTNWWAIPEDSEVRTLGADGAHSNVTLENRIVLMTVFTEGLLNATTVYDTMLQRSLNWVMGNTTSVTYISVEQNNVVVYPNPAQDFAKVRFTLSNTQDVRLSLTNMMGQQVSISATQRFPQGMHEINLNTEDLPKGMYLYMLQIGDAAITGKLNLAK